MPGDHRFWLLFGGIWLLLGGGFTAGSLALLLLEPAAIEDPALTGIFLAAGLAFSAAGGFVIWRARAVAARDLQLLESGISIPATVTDVRRSAVTINREPRWHVRYRYQYGVGQTFEGESRALRGPVAQPYAPGDRVLIRVGPQRPQDSVFVGPA